MHRVFAHQPTSLAEQKLHGQYLPNLNSNYPSPHFKSSLHSQVYKDDIYLLIVEKGDL